MTKPKVVPNYKLSPIELAAIENFAKHNGRSWKARLREIWMSPEGFSGPFAPALLRLRNTWGPKGLEKFKRPDLTSGERIGLPTPIPEAIFRDVRRHVLEDVAAEIDLREEKRRPLLAKIASDRAEVLGYDPGLGLDKAQMLWMRCYRHLMTTLVEVPIL